MRVSRGRRRSKDLGFEGTSDPRPEHDDGPVGDGHDVVLRPEEHDERGERREPGRGAGLAQEHRLHLLPGLEMRLDPFCELVAKCHRRRNLVVPGRGRCTGAGSRATAARAGRLPYSSRVSAEMKASWGTSTRPMFFIFFLPSFCFSSSLRLRVMSPP